MTAQSTARAQGKNFDELFELLRGNGIHFHRELYTFLENFKIDLDRIAYDLALCSTLCDGMENVLRAPDKDLISLRVGILLSNLVFDHVDIQDFRDLFSDEDDQEALDQIEAIIQWRLSGFLDDEVSDPNRMAGLDDSTFVLTAILKLIMGLNTSLTYSTNIVDLVSSSQGVRIKIAGPQAYSDLITAQAASRFLAQALRIPVFVHCDQAPTNVQLKCLSVDLSSIGVAPFDQTSEAARKILRFHFARMGYHEPGTREGQDVEELHDMRVATRRMRSAFNTFRPFYRKKVIKPFAKYLRLTGSALGKVRDLDVFLENARSDIETMPGAGGLDLSALIEYWQGKRALARSEMIRHFDSDRHQEFLLDFNRFLNSPFAGVKRNRSADNRRGRIQDAAVSSIMHHWVRLNAFDDEVADASIKRLHKLRIEIKKLRYLVEFLRDVLGYESEQIVDEMKLIQDHLGNLNDAFVASMMISEFLEEVRPDQFEESIRGGVASAEEYLFLKKEECANLVATFPEIWLKFAHSGFETRLLAMAAEL